MLNPLRTAAKVGAALALAATAIVVSPASPAAAATPQCTKSVEHLPDHPRALVPALVVGDDSDRSHWRTPTVGHGSASSSVRQ